MRPSEIYEKIEEALAGSDALKEIPRIKNTYQEELLDEEAKMALRSPGLVICYYFYKCSPTGTNRPSLFQGDAHFTIAVVENLTQHEQWLANNTVTDMRKDSALEIAEEILALVAQENRGLSPCGFRDTDFEKSAMERVVADKGKAQFDVNVIAPCQIKAS